MKEILHCVPCHTHFPVGDAELSSFDAVLKAPSIEALGLEVRKVSKKLGFEHYLYGAHVPLPSGERLQYVFSGYPVAWSEAYVEKDYIQVDPIVRHCLFGDSNLPIIWSDEVFSSESERSFWEDAQGYGVSSGLTIPIRGIAGEVALLSVANPERDYLTRHHDMQMIGAAYLLGAYVHESIRRLVYEKEIRPRIHKPLTMREHECLKWWVSGKTVDEVGLILGLSERTVRFHLVNVKQKLNANSKAQAIAKAVQLKLV